MHIKILQKFIILVVLQSAIFSQLFSESAYCSSSEMNYPKATQGYCGLYCSYLALGIYDIEIDFKELVKPEYMGSSLGSSMAELQLLIENHGLQSEIITNLTVSDLYLIDFPSILHVKSKDSKKYDHYLLLVKCTGNKAHIYDPPSPVEVISYGELASIWDGNALIVSTEPILTKLLSSSYLNRGMVWVVFLGVFVVSCWVFKYIFFFLLSKYSIKLTFLSRAILSFASVFIIVGISVFAAFTYHFVNGAGFFISSSGVNGIQKTYAGSFIRKIALGKMQRIYDDGDAVIFDARLKRDFDTGHIDGAVSLPINCSDEDYTQAVSSLPRDKRIVLYCQSAGCKFAEKIAVRFKEDGFENLSVFRGGWVEWQEMNKSQSVKAEGQKNENETLS